MTRKAKITIHSIQMQDGQREELHFIYDGQYHQKGGYHYVLYHEPVEDSKERIRNLMKYTKHSLHVTKKGSFSSEMQFEVGRTYLSEYHTPFGLIPISMHTHHYSASKRDDGTLYLEIQYDLIVEHRHLVNCQMEIEIDHTKNKKS